MTATGSARSKRVVIVGAGFGGLRTARRLAHSPVDVTLIDANNYHTFQPFLYQVATAGLDSDDVCFPVRGTLRRQRNARFVLGRVSAFDLDQRCVTLADGRQLPYDYLVIAAGSVSTTFGIPGAEENSFPLKNLDDAMALRSHLLGLYERASAGEPVDLGVAIVGGGPTGIETAGGLRELVDHVLRKDFPELDLARVPITLVEADERVLNRFHPALSSAAADALTRRNVEVVVGVGVERVEHGRVLLRDGRVIVAGTAIWAAGVTGSPLAAALGVPLARGGRIPVTDDLSLAGHPEVFAIGDIASSPTDDGYALPQVAQPAIQGGTYVAQVIDARVRGSADRIAPFKYHDEGSMATIGRNQAIAELSNGWRFHGFVGWVMWLGLHIIYLVGFRNRAKVLLNWTWNYLTYDRGSRLLLPSERTGD